MDLCRHIGNAGYIFIQKAVIESYKADGHKTVLMMAILVCCGLAKICVLECTIRNRMFLT